MTDTPTAKELFLAVWQARMSVEPGAPVFEDEEDIIDWCELWRDCVVIATKIRVASETD